MGFLNNNSLSVIPHLMRDLYANSQRINRSRNRFGNIFILLFILLFTCSQSFSQTPETIKIGFLIRDKDDKAIQHTAELAIEIANEQGGYKGQKFELVTRSCDGPWGITSKQAVALIYEDQVPIVVTALDGRNAHLAEQVTAKSHMVMLSTLSSDPTLSRAYVPWYFRMVPDDRQQAQFLVEKIYSRDKEKKVAIFSLDNYDGKMSVEAFVAETKVKGYPPPTIIDDISNQEIVEKSIENSWDAVVLTGSSSEANKFIGQLKAARYYAFLNLYNFNGVTQIIDPGIKTIFSSWEKSSFWKEFQETYQNNYHEKPKLSHAYIYDGIMLTVESIKKYGPDSETIRQNFKELKYQGITGKVEFDKFGNRLFE